jgi:hypothetical protein
MSPVETDWIFKCAHRYMERADMNWGIAIDAATACFEACGLQVDPIEAADEDMENWSD